MLSLADLHPGDVVYDLGCGDGRIVIAAVKAPRRARGVRRARSRAPQVGARGRRGSGSLRPDPVRQGDLFEVPIEDATVVTLYLLRPTNLRLRPRLLSELSPGTRVVSYRFDMGNWEAERTEKVGDRSIYRWTIPAPGSVR
jgi:hypothetical protein